MKKCSDVMTKDPTLCLPTDTVGKAAQLMKSENIGSLPVIESEGTRKLVGIVTDRDLAVKVVAADRDSGATKLSDVMTQMVYTCNADDDVMVAVATMAEHQLRRLPVVDKDAKVVGIISQADIATRVNLPEETGEMVKEISQPTA
ncbi:MAG: CBS domain-containing protein [Anaerolineae bacterium]|nr:MAG: CBS domain-containing protein [Anaerolineae bacterium]